MAGGSMVNSKQMRAFARWEDVPVFDSEEAEASFGLKAGRT
jgi:hypothetical protein